MPRPPAFANWPYNHAWWFLPSGRDDAGNSNPNVPGRVRIAYLETMQYWDIHVRAMDALAKAHMESRASKPGQPIQMPDGRVLEIPYFALDDDADAMMQRGMAPSPDRSPLTIVCRDGTKINQAPRDWWEQLVVAHINRRKSEPPVVLDLGNGIKIQETYEFFDALCKDFLRRRGDLVAVGWWPELLMGDYGQFKDGPKPVEGRADALGRGVTVLNAQVPPPAGQPVAHPMLDNMDLT